KTTSRPACPKQRQTPLAAKPRTSPSLPRKVLSLELLRQCPFKERHGVAPDAPIPQIAMVRVRLDPEFVLVGHQLIQPLAIAHVDGPVPRTMGNEYRLAYINDPLVDRELVLHH